MADKRFVAKNGLDNNSQTIVNVANPSQNQDAATKAYVDGLTTDTAITGKLLTGYASAGTGAGVLATNDTILAAFGKVQGQLSARITASYLDDYTRGNYRVISDYQGISTWYIRATSPRFIWARGHDWSESFELDLSSGTANSNDGWATLGQQTSNVTNGTWRGVRFSQYSAGGAIDGDARARRYYLGDNTNYIVVGNLGAIRSQTASGFVDIGAMNTSHAHLQTDRPSFYFNKDVYVDGVLYQYTGAYPYINSNTIGNYALLLSGGTVTGQTDLKVRKKASFLEYHYEWGGAQDLNWKRIARIGSTATDGWRGTSGYLVVYAENSNHGVTQRDEYHVKFFVQYSTNSTPLDVASLSGSPSASNYIRFRKLGTRDYELQVRQPSDWLLQGAVFQLDYNAGNLTAVEPSGTPPNGSAGVSDVAMGTLRDNINIIGVSGGVGTTDPSLGTGGLWVVSGTGLNVARNSTSYVVVDSGNVGSYALPIGGGTLTGQYLDFSNLTPSLRVTSGPGTFNIGDDDIVNLANGALIATPSSRTSSTVFAVDITGTARVTGSVIVGTDPGGSEALRVGSGGIRTTGTIYANDFVLTGGTGSGTGLTLDSLDDVRTGAPYAPTNGQVLTWDTSVTPSPGQWIPKTLVTTLAVQGGGSAVGSRQTLNFINGSNATFSVADDPTNNRVNVTVNATGAVSSVFGRTGAVTLLNTDVTTALGYTPLSNAGGTLSGSLSFTDSTNSLAKVGDRLEVRSEGVSNVANFASYGLYLPQTGQTAGLYVESPIEARAGLRIGSGATSGTITVGATTAATADRLVQRDGNGYITFAANQPWPTFNQAAAAGTLTGTTLASGVTSSSLTTVGSVLHTGRWHKVFDYYLNGTPTNGVQITTTIPFTSGIGMYTIICEGYRYGGAVPEGWMVSFYPYNGGGGTQLVNHGASSWGGAVPTLKLGVVGGVICLFLEEQVYFRRFTLRMVYGAQSETASHAEGWSASDNTASTASATNVITPTFTNAFGNVTATNLTVTNTISGSISGNADTVDSYHASSLLRSVGNPGYGDWDAFGNTEQTVREIYQEHFNVGTNTGSSNFPSSASYKYGTLINFGAAASARAQVYISHVGNDLIFRGGWTTTGWHTWNKVLTDQNYGSYALPLSGGTLTGTTYFSGANGGLQANYNGGVSFYGNEINSGANGVTGSLYIGQRNTTEVYIRGNVALQAGNYNSYAPSLTGAGATGSSWAISITGNAATATTASSTSGNAATATVLQTARNINGTSFNGAANITTASWGTARTITIGSTGKSVDGSGNVSWTLGEIGALGASAKAADSDLFDGIDSPRFLYGSNGSGSTIAAVTQNVYELAQYKSGFWDVNGASWTPDTGWWWGATFAHTSNSSSYNYSGQIAFQNSGGGDNVYARTISNGSGGSWSRLLSSGNYSSYALPLSGGTVTGNITAPDFILSSDVRLKTDLVPLTAALDSIDQLTAYRYTHIRHSRQEVGVLAHEIRDVLPEAVTEGADGMLGVSYDRLVPLLLAAVKELSAKVKYLERLS